MLVLVFVRVVPTQIHAEFHGIIHEGVIGEEPVFFESRDPVCLVFLVKELSDPLDRHLGFLGRSGVVFSSVRDVRFLKEFGQARLNGLASMLQLLQAVRPSAGSGEHLLGEPAGARTIGRAGPGTKILDGLGAQVPSDIGVRVRKSGQEAVQVLVGVGFGIVDEGGEETTVLPVHGGTRGKRMGSVGVASQLVA